MIDEIDQIGLQADLIHTTCQLNHGPLDRERHQAVDYLVIPMAENSGNDTAEIRADLVIPICQDCIDALQGNEWTLLYCLDCAKSQWILRAAARLNYRHHVIWLKGCPECGGKFRGIYFNDATDLTWELAGKKIEPTGHKNINISGQKAHA